MVLGHPLGIVDLGRAAFKVLGNVIVIAPLVKHLAIHAVYSPRGLLLALPRQLAFAKHGWIAGSSRRPLIAFGELQHGLLGPWIG